MSVMSARLRELLDSEPYPRDYVHKFIGKNTEVFRAAVTEMLGLWPQARAHPTRESSNGAYISVSWTVRITSADDVEKLMTTTMQLPDLKALL